MGWAQRVPEVQLDNMLTGVAGYMVHQHRGRGDVVIVFLFMLTDVGGYCSNWTEMAESGHSAWCASFYSDNTPWETLIKGGGVGG